ncbi:O-antigen ligase family protein [Marinobacter sp.]|uniref:O-antigen ligase family protein n=1 Tax=Marinobacter sp. TaxID=50741 RepID=UPI003A9004BC
MAKVLWVLLFWIAFLLPVHLFPFQDLPNDLAAMLLACSLFAFVMVTGSRSAFRVPVIFFLLLAVLFSVVLSAFFVGEFIFTDYTYAIFIVCGLLLTVSVANLKVTSDELIESLALSLVVVAAFTAIYGLLRYYGVLNLYFPWMTAESARLLGPLNQANLTSLVLAFGIAASCYLVRVKRMGLPLAMTISMGLAVAGSLTGSRALVGFVFMVLLIPVFKGIISDLGIKVMPKTLLETSKSSLAVVFAVLMVIFLYPMANKPVLTLLVEEGVLERVSNESVADRFGLTDSYREEEWRKLYVYNDLVENTLTGVGPGRYAKYSIDADAVIGTPQRSGTLWIHSHNLFINALVELGYIGFLTVLAIIGYLVFLFIRVPSDPKHYFIFTLLGMLFLNNMVEFSFWMFGFFALGVSLVALCDRHVEVKTSSQGVVVLVGVLVLATSIGSFLYVGKDAWASIYGFHKSQLTEEERYRFLDAKKNRFIGGDAFKAQIIREKVSLFGVKAQMQELEGYLVWRPEMAFMMRYSVLQSVVGPQDKACEIVKKTVRLYPKSVERLVDELAEAKDLGATYNIDFIHRCIADGMMYWVERGN